MGAQRWGPHGWRVDGDCVIQGDQHFTGSLVVTGLLAIGKGACVEGDVKSHQGVVIGEHARVTGSVVCDEGVRLFDDAFVGGPLVCESVLQLGSGARLGSLHAPTSVSAAVILAGDGATAHGSVRASQAGLVWGPA
jgi:cytoskeletal protein CcmA (bactofilin family)